MADAPKVPGSTPAPDDAPTGGMDASTEPEAQIAAAMASPASPTAGLPDTGSTASTPSASTSYGDGSSYRSADALVPSRSDYEMPDDYADDWLTNAKAWIEANPALAVLAAAGIGLVVGRLVLSAMPDEEPTLARRVERRAADFRKEAKHAKKGARRYAKEARGYAEDAGETIQDQLAHAAEALAAAAGLVSHKAEAGYERSKEAAEAGYEKTKDLAEVVADAAKAAVAAVMAKKSDSWLKRMRD